MRIDASHPSSRSGNESKGRRSQAERSRATRSLIARTAFEQIRDQGYATFRVASVATAAGVSTGALTHHFATKEDIALSAIEYALELAQTRTERNIAAFEANADADPVEAFLQECSDYYFSASFDVAMDVVKSASGVPELKRTIARLHRQYRAFVESQWLQELIAAGWVEADARDVIDLSASVVRGFAIRAMIRPDRSDLERLMSRWRCIMESHFES